MLFPHHRFSDRIGKFQKHLWWSSFVAGQLGLKTWTKIDFSSNIKLKIWLVHWYMDISSWNSPKFSEKLLSGITLKSFYFCVNSCFASSFGAVQNWILLRNQIYGQDEFHKCYYRLWHLHIKLLQPQVPCFSCFMYPLQVQLYTSKETFLIEIFLRKLEIVSKGWMKIRGFKRKIIGEKMKRKKMEVHASLSKQGLIRIFLSLKRKWRYHTVAPDTWLHLVESIHTLRLKR